MSTLLLRLAAPLQSWGVDAKLERRGTARIPTKSGVLGLVAAALGIQRNDKDGLGDLNIMRFGVRVDREGILLRDYHTAKSRKAAYVTNRYYLSDAVFMAGLEGEEALLKDIDIALHHPMFPLFLGRRACPPEGRISLGIRIEKTLLEALKEEPWLLSDWQRRKVKSDMHLRIVMDGTDQDNGIHFQRDVPLSFDQSHRQFGFRRICENVLHIVPTLDGKSFDDDSVPENHSSIEPMED